MLFDLSYETVKNEFEIESNVAASISTSFSLGKESSLNTIGSEKMERIFEFALNYQVILSNIHLSKLFHYFPKNCTN